VTTASANDDANNDGHRDANDEQTANESAALPRPKRAPWLIRPSTLLIASLVGFAANWWSGVYQPQGLNMLGIACGRTALRTEILTDVVLGVYALAGLVIALAIVRCFWRRVGITSSVFAVVMVPIVIACALLNVWLAYTAQSAIGAAVLCGR
jgi:hypothetical protein